METIQRSETLLTTNDARLGIQSERRSDIQGRFVAPRGISSRQRTTANVYGKFIIMASRGECCNNSGFQNIISLTSSNTPSKLRLCVTWNFFSKTCCDTS